RTPGRVAVQVQTGSLVVQRAGPESGRVHVPWPVPGLGRPFLATATLAERAHIYDLGVELARGRLNDIRNQAGDWELMGLEVTPEFGAGIAEAQRAFAKAAPSRDDPAASARAAENCLAIASDAGRILVEAYTNQLLQARLGHAPKLPTFLSCGLD